MRNLALSICFIFGVALAEQPDNKTLASFTRQFESLHKDSTWQLHPLTCFPYLKGQAFPWSYECQYCYTTVENYRHGVICATRTGTCYIGSKQTFDSLYFYTATSFQYEKGNWSYLMEFVIVTNRHNEILGVHRRTDPEADFEKVKLFNE